MGLIMKQILLTHIASSETLALGLNLKEKNAILKVKSVYGMLQVFKDCAIVNVFLLIANISA